MSEYTDLAVDLFERGFNCAQSVLAVFCEKYGADIDTAARAAAGFGGGLGCGEACGALSGAIMVVGQKYGAVEPEDAAAKENCRARTTEVTERFRARNGAVRCSDLLGCQTSTPEGRERYEADGLRARICVPAVVGAVEILEEIGY
ncbi:MAG: C-GCAxxG-C-C family protein [Oscillospiraceae bacterium]|nr:C-GCAxxG-C-C family protein [Oscillospiraceae bacterium]